MSTEEGGRDLSEGGRKLFIGNISYSTTEKELEEVFKAYGPVQECRVAVSSDGRSKGFAFLTMENSEDARDAMDKLAGGFQLGDRTIRIELTDGSRRPRPRDDRGRGGYRGDRRDYGRDRDRDYGRGRDRDYDRRDRDRDYGRDRDRDYGRDRDRDYDRRDRERESGRDQRDGDRHRRDRSRDAY